MPVVVNPVRVSRLGACWAVFVTTLVTGTPYAQATFHLWQVNEVYSNADGSVQYIELFTAFSSQQFTNGTTINARDNGAIINTFTFPSNTPSPTGGHHLLIATPGFAALPGGITPDFTLPTAPFFNPDSPASAIEYVFADTLNFTATDLPTDGVLSLNRNLTTGANSPTDFAGEVGSLGGPPPLTGDLDGDGFVGIADLNIVLGNWNQNVSAGDPLVGDPSGDGFVGIEDLNQVLGNWNAGTPPADGVTVPEPATLAMLGLAAAGLLRTRG